MTTKNLRGVLSGVPCVESRVIFKMTHYTLATVVAIAVARSIASLLFAISPWDLPCYLGMALALVLVAIASGYLPARRASSINPMEALRNN